MTLNARLGKSYGKGGTKNGRILPWKSKSVGRSRQDIKTWNQALNMSRNGENPQNFAIQHLFEEMCIDALLTSQIENRKNQVHSTTFSLKKPNGEVDEEQTKKLKKMPLYRFLNNAKLDSIYKKYSLVQFEQKKVNDKLVLVPELIPRANVVPQSGKFYPDYGDLVNYTLYRELPEFGTYILEFCREGDGLLNKVIPHVLFKRFAQACWSELCEIYGIPPRFMKTNTQNPTMLKRAEAMMRDMGSAAWFIIDDSESFEFAKGVATSGDVYKNLIDLCRDEICLVITGAIISQDTKNGSKSKDQIGMDILWELVKSDLAMLEDDWNNVTIPALVKHGVLTGELTLEFQEAEDLDALWKYVQGLLAHYKIEPDWIKQKFGVEITGERTGETIDKEDLKAIIEKLSAEPPNDQTENERIESLIRQALTNVKKEDPNFFSHQPSREAGDLQWTPPVS